MAFRSQAFVAQSPIPLSSPWALVMESGSKMEKRKQFVDMSERKALLVRFKLLIYNGVLFSV